MLRVKRSVLLGVLIGLSSQASAVGLGDIALDSYVNEPLQANILLLDTGSLAEPEIRVALASSEDFERLGVERLFSLGDLSFSTELDGRGGGSITVESSEPILEPYLNFLVELRWPSGRLLREYTVLIDLPPARPLGDLAAMASDSAVVSSVPDVPETSFSSTSNSDTQYRVKTDDTLWEVAAAVKPSELSVEQMMLAIQAANPNAFLRNNINGLKAGYLLSFPVDVVSGQSEREARQAVADQWRVWREPAQPALRIVADSELEFDLDPISPAPDMDSERLVERVSEASATAPSVGDSNLALIEERLTQLSTQVGELQGVVQEKDAEIAELQRALTDALKENQALDRAVTDTADTGSQSSPPVEPQASSSWLQALLYLVLLGALIAGGALLVLRRLRDSGGELSTDPLGSDDLVAADDPLRPVPSIPGEPEQERAEPDSKGYGESLLTGYANDQTLADAVAEADIYVAYGRHQHALDTLEAASSAEPSNASGLLKMLEIYLSLDRVQEAEELIPVIEATGDLVAHSAAVERLNNTGAVLTGVSQHDALLTDGSETSTTEASGELVAEAGSTDAEDENVDSDDSPELDVPEATGSLSSDDSLSIDLEFAEDTAEESPNDVEDALDSDMPAIDEDAIETNLELARAYIDMGDHDGAKELLDSVLAKGDLSQQAAAQELLKTLP